MRLFTMNEIRNARKNESVSHSPPLQISYMEGGEEEYFCLFLSLFFPNFLHSALMNIT